MSYGAGHFRAAMNGHDWRTAGTTRDRERCHHCRAIRSRAAHGGWIYCQIGGDELTKDPGCHPLPGTIGVPFVDGERDLP